MALKGRLVTVDNKSPNEKVLAMAHATSPVARARAPSAAAGENVAAAR
jgi:hypothetical protein